MTNAHWRIPPALDARLFLPPARRGERAPGHVGDAADCPRCNATPEAAPMGTHAPLAPADAGPVRVDVVGPREPTVAASAEPVVTLPVEPAVAPPVASDAIATTEAAALRCGPSIGDLVLLGAFDATRGGTCDVSTADLIVAAWQRAPMRLGLLGYAAQHPDSNRVIAKLCGDKGLCARGLVRRAARSTYALTKAGRRRARALLRQSPAISRQTVSHDVDGAP